MTYSDEQVNAAAGALLEAMLVDLADAPDDEEFPIGRLMGDLADEHGFPFARRWDRHAVMTVGELRRRSRAGLAELAAGRGPA